MKKKKSNYTNEEINYKELEVVFTDEIYRLAMKQLPNSEKFAIYVCTFKNKYLERLCNDYQISKVGFIQLKDIGINHFKRNVRKYKTKGYKKNNNTYYKKNGGV